MPTIAPHIKEYPKIIISFDAPNDINDPNDYKNISYQRIHDAILAGFNSNGNIDILPSDNIIYFYYGLEAALEFALINKIEIIVTGYSSFNQNYFDMSRRYYPSVNIIQNTYNTSQHHILLTLPQHVMFIGFGNSLAEGNIHGYNIDFFVNQISNFTETPAGYFAGKILWLMFKTDLTFWQCRDLLMRCGDYNVIATESPSDYFIHYSEINGWGMPNPVVAESLARLNYHVFSQDPFLLYKLRTKEMQTEQSTLITSVLMTADRTKNLFIGLDGALCGNGAKALGVLNADTSINEYGPVMTSGIALVVSGAAVTLGSKVQSNASGQAITFASGESNGFALDAATGASQLIRVLLS
ncbi:MAG: DUF2190 family protein [Ignavibacteriae bacterium]|nr:DUF2190 family protein [Ignavibacteriota bacterium]